MSARAAGSWRNVTRRLPESGANAPFVLAQQKSAELGEFLRTVLERSQDSLAVDDGEGDDNAFGVECALELAGGWFVDAPNQLSHDGSRHGNSRDRRHRGDRTPVLWKT
jgi:hypothetical protein